VIILFCFCLYFISWSGIVHIHGIEGMDNGDSSLNNVTCTATDPVLRQWLYDLSMNVSQLDNKINNVANSKVSEATKNLPPKPMKL